jgi:hypothetical protein
MHRPQTNDERKQALYSEPGKRDVLETHDRDYSTMSERNESDYSITPFPGINWLLEALSGDKFF